MCCIPNEQHLLMDSALDPALMDMVASQPTWIGSPRPGWPTDLNRLLDLL